MVIQFSSHRNATGHHMVHNRFGRLGWMMMMERWCNGEGGGCGW